MQLKKDEWDKSYSKNENYIFFPKEQIVKFLSRYVRKYVGPGEYKTLVNQEKLKGLDLGCGVGRQVVLLDDFAIKAYGLDISEIAISKSRELFNYFKRPYLSGHVQVFDGNVIPFEDETFDVLICDSVLDSMSFDVAKNIYKEIVRTSKGFIYFNLIAGSCDEKGARFGGESVVEKIYEQGTIQSYFNEEKILALVKHPKIKVHDIELVSSVSHTTGKVLERYNVILEKIK